MAAGPGSRASWANSARSTAARTAAESQRLERFGNVLVHRQAPRWPWPRATRQTDCWRNRASTSGGTTRNCVYTASPPRPLYSAPASVRARDAIGPAGQLVKKLVLARLAWPLAAANRAKGPTAANSRASASDSPGLRLTSWYPWARSVSADVKMACSMSTSEASSLVMCGCRRCGARRPTRPATTTSSATARRFSTSHSNGSTMPRGSIRKRNALLAAAAAASRVAQAPATPAAKNRCLRNRCWQTRHKPGRMPLGVGRRIFEARFALVGLAEDQRHRAASPRPSSGSLRQLAQVAQQLHREVVFVERAGLQLRAVDQDQHSVAAAQQRVDHAGTSADGRLPRTGLRRPCRASPVRPAGGAWGCAAGSAPSSSDRARWASCWEIRSAPAPPACFAAASPRSRRGPTAAVASAAATACRAACPGRRSCRRRWDPAPRTSPAPCSATAPDAPGPSAHSSCGRSRRRACCLRSQIKQGTWLP